MSDVVKAANSMEPLVNAESQPSMAASQLPEVPPMPAHGGDAEMAATPNAEPGAEEVQNVCGYLHEDGYHSAADLIERLAARLRAA